MWRHLEACDTHTTRRRRAFHEFSYDSSVSSSQWQPRSAQVCDIPSIQMIFVSQDTEKGAHFTMFSWKMYVLALTRMVLRLDIEVHVLHRVSDNHSLRSYIPIMPDLTVLSISALIKLCFPIFFSRNTDIQNKESRQAKHRLLDCSFALDSKTVSPLENMICDLLNN